MVLGAIAFSNYACTVCQTVIRCKLPAAIVAIGSVLIWLAVAFGLEAMLGAR
jgi:hypothetical protein